jgi:hypothetical protein
MDSVSLKQFPKFSGERKHFGVSHTLKAGFKDMLPANDAIL